MQFMHPQLEKLLKWERKEEYMFRQAKFLKKMKIRIVLPYAHLYEI